MIHIDDISLGPRMGGGGGGSLSVAYLFFSMIALILFTDYVFFPPGVITPSSSLTTPEDKLIPHCLACVRCGLGLGLCTQSSRDVGVCNGSHRLGNQLVDNVFESLGLIYLILM